MSLTFKITIPESIPDSLKSEYLKWISNKVNYTGKHPVTAKILEELTKTGESDEKTTKS